MSDHDHPFVDMIQAPPLKDHVILSLYHTDERGLTWWREGGGYTLFLEEAEHYTVKDAKDLCFGSPNRNFAIKTSATVAIAKTFVPFEMAELAKLGITMAQFKDSRR